MFSNGTVKKHTNKNNVKVISMGWIKGKCMCLNETNIAPNGPKWYIQRYTGAWVSGKSLNLRIPPQHIGICASPLHPLRLTYLHHPIHPRVYLLTRLFAESDSAPPHPLHPDALNSPHHSYPFYHLPKRYEERGATFSLFLLSSSSLSPGTFLIFPLTFLSLNHFLCSLPSFISQCAAFLLLPRLFR